MPEYPLILPTLHAGQVDAFRSRSRFTAVRAGRRWGKTVFGETIAADAIAKGQLVGWFAPETKFLSETFVEMKEMLSPIIANANSSSGVIRSITGGRMDFWTLENERAGRSRKYHVVVIDEAAFAKDNMMKIWSSSIKPTLLDYRGRAWVLSNTNGVNPENFLWRICNETDPITGHGFTQYHAPTSSNPHMPADELEQLQRTTPPLVFQQEYLAEFVDWSGLQFFELARCLMDGVASDYPQIIDAVFATIDTETKTGKEHDGTAVMFWGLNRATNKLFLLEWDIVQIEGALLEVWLPLIFARLEELAIATKARMGSLGAYIEDKSSGTILLQQSQRRGLPAQSIDSKLTSLGKDERCINISGYVYRGHVQITKYAYDKTVAYKGQTRNHMLSQVFGYRLGVLNQLDDLLDAWCYGIAIALGNSGGY